MRVLLIIAAVAFSAFALVFAYWLVTKIVAAAIGFLSGIVPRGAALAFSRKRVKTLVWAMDSFPDRFEFANGVMKELKTGAEYDVTSFDRYGQILPESVRFRNFEKIALRQAILRIEDRADAERDDRAATEHLDAYCKDAN